MLGPDIPSLDVVAASYLISNDISDSQESLVGNRS